MVPAAMPSLLKTPGAIPSHYGDDHVAHGGTGSCGDKLISRFVLDQFATRHPELMPVHVQQLHDHPTNFRSTKYTTGDGTLIVEKNYIPNPAQVELLPGAV